MCGPKAHPMLRADRQTVTALTTLPHTAAAAERTGTHPKRREDKCSNTVQMNNARRHPHTHPAATQPLLLMLLSSFCGAAGVLKHPSSSSFSSARGASRQHNGDAHAQTHKQKGTQTHTVSKQQTLLSQGNRASTATMLNGPQQKHHVHICLLLHKTQ